MISGSKRFISAVSGRDRVREKKNFKLQVFTQLVIKIIFLESFQKKKNLEPGVYLSGRELA
jgi:hypothetical protein